MGGYRLIYSEGSGRSMAGVKWKENELKYLIDNYKGKNSCKSIAEKLNRSRKSVYDKAHRLGLKVEWTYKRIDKDGYIEIVLGSSVKVREYRYVYEQHSGKTLNSKDVIHHLDEDKQHNDWNNLILLNPTTHNLLHDLIMKKDANKLIKFIVHVLPCDQEKYLKWLDRYVI